MLIEDYKKMLAEVGTDLSVSSLTRLAEGTTLLVKLSEEAVGCVGVHSTEDILYVGGPLVEDLSEEDARNLMRLGFRVFEEDLGFQFFT